MRRALGAAALPIAALASAALLAACDGGGEAVARCPFLGGCDTIRPPPPGSAAAEATATAPPPIPLRERAAAPTESLVAPAVAATVEVSPARATLWVGDSIRLLATARDAAGRELADLPVRWSGPGNAPASISAEGSVVARAPGSVRVVASAPGAAAEATIDVLPIARGRVLALDGSPVSGARVVLRGGETALGASTDGRGAFTLRLPSRPAAALSIALRPRASDSTRLHPALVELRASDLSRDVTVLLLPRRWRIEGGRLDGVVVPISALAATRRARDGSRFWRLHRSSVTGETSVVGWPGGALPLPLVARGRLASPPAAAAGIWRAARALEREVGSPLFRAATPDEAAAGRGLVEVDVDPRIGEAGLTYVAYAGGGEIVDASIYLRSADTADDGETVMHELLHALGFGHAAAWPSLMEPRGRAAALTAQDIAHVQLMLRARDAQAALGARFAIVAAEAAERAEGGAASATP
jgi:hypothetical protein